MQLPCPRQHSAAKKGARNSIPNGSRHHTTTTAMPSKGVNVIVILHHEMDGSSSQCKDWQMDA
jgi:hypothetical protein